MKSPLLANNSFTDEVCRVFEGASKRYLIEKTCLFQSMKRHSKKSHVHWTVRWGWIEFSNKTIIGHITAKIKDD